MFARGRAAPSILRHLRHRRGRARMAGQGGVSRSALTASRDLVTYDLDFLHGSACRSAKVAASMKDHYRQEDSSWPLRKKLCKSLPSLPA